MAVAGNTTGHQLYPTTATLDPLPDWCEDRKRLFLEAVAAIKSLIDLQEVCARAIRPENPARTHFEGDVSVALRYWKTARQAYLNHVQAHGC